MKEFTDKLIGFSTRLAQNRVINVIQASFMDFMPVSMIGGFAALFNGIGIPAYQSFIKSTGIQNICSVIYQWTIGMIALYLAFLVAYEFSKKYECGKNNIAVGLTSLAAFLIITPFTPAAADMSSPASLPFTWLGASGMFTAIIVAFITGNIFRLCSHFKLEIKLPSSVPPMVSMQFSALIPFAIDVVLFGIINLLFAATPLKCFHQLIYTIVSAPLSKVGANVFGGWILMVVLYGLWFCGIHGGMTVGPIINILFMQLQIQNMTAFQAGQALPNAYVGDALSIGTGSLPLVVAILLVCKSSSNRSIAKLGLLPALFGVDEPMYFGVPMILNPVFFIPWVILSPTLTVWGTALLKAVHLLGYSNGTGGQNAANLPFFVGNIMNYGIPGLIWGCIFFIIAVAFYIPFVKAYDQQMLNQENGQNKE